MKKLIAATLILFLFGAGGAYLYAKSRGLSVKDEVAYRINSNPVSLSSFVGNSVDLKTLSGAKTLDNNYHVFQTFNNCGPASLSMALSYYGIRASQQELGQALRPYQNSAGDNDDKSTMLYEMAEKSKDYGLIPFHRPMGDINMLKMFIEYDIPVITRTILNDKEDIGHYRVIKGYDDKTQQITQDDSYEGKNLKYSYDDFNKIWKWFDYEYLVLVPKDKLQIAEKIIGENVDVKTSWNNAIKLSQQQLEENPNDVYARFNLSVAYYNVGEFVKSVYEFEQVENKLSPRTLWYQIEPIQAYYQLKNYDRVMQITDKILNNGNRAFSELYVLRAQVYKAQGDDQKAAEELDKAKFYNKNLTLPQL
jgi:tetratricopeptide (TPR) repeat protein